jgi:hypothetical protein
MWLVRRGSSHEQGLKGPSRKAPGNEESAFYQRVTAYGRPETRVRPEMTLKGKTDSKKSISVGPGRSLSRVTSASCRPRLLGEERARINALMN